MYNSHPVRKREVLFPPEPARLQYSEGCTVMKCHIKFGYYAETLELPGSVRFIPIKKLLLAMACLIWLPRPFPIMLGHRESSALNGLLPLI